MSFSGYPASAYMQQPQGQPDLSQYGYGAQPGLAGYGAPASGWDKAALIGAAIKDAASTAMGRDSNATGQVRNNMLQMQMLSAQRALVPAAMQGDRGALAQLAAINPQQAASVLQLARASTPLHTMTADEMKANNIDPSALGGSILQTDPFTNAISAVKYGDTESNARVKQQEGIYSDENSYNALPSTDPAYAGMRAGTVIGRNKLGNTKVMQASDVKSDAAMSQERDLITARENADIAKMQAMYGTGPGGMATPGTPDPNSGALTGQTGLSQPALDYLLTGAKPRSSQAYMAITKEVTNFSNKNGIDTGTLTSQAKAYNNILQNNLQRNNQGGVLENEINGTVNTLAPLADAVGQGKVNIGNIANVWAGKQVNDPNVQGFADQLNRLREEVAGYNAVAGGKLTENGTPRPDEGDYRAAEAIISGGINAGGARGLLSSIQASAAKNKQVLGAAIDDANQGVWNLLGVGKNYKRKNGPAVTAGGGSSQIAPAGTKAMGPNSHVLTSDGKGGWN